MNTRTHGNTESKLKGCSFFVAEIKNKKYLVCTESQINYIKAIFRLDIEAYEKEVKPEEIDQVVIKRIDEGGYITFDDAAKKLSPDDYNQMKMAYRYGGYFRSL